MQSKPNTWETVRQFRAAPFALAVLCFLLPFAQFSCTMDRKMNFPLTGLQMVTGSEIQVPNFDMGPAFGSGPTKKQEISPNPLAVTAILCSLAGLVLSFVRSRSASVIAAIAGGIGFLFLLGLKAHLDQEVLTKGEGLFVVEYRIGFVAACFLLAAGAAMHGFLIRQTPEKSP